MAKKNPAKKALSQKQPRNRQRVQQAPANKRQSRGTIWDRTRGWLLLEVDDPEAAAGRVSELFCCGGDYFVVVRADVVKSAGFNLIVPIDAAKDYWETAVDLVVDFVKPRTSKTAQVVTYHPAVPHRASCFVTQKEHKLFRLDEYDPPGRHPKSPGANPWG
jgi:hypothetical protein